MMTTLPTSNTYQEYHENTKGNPSSNPFHKRFSGAEDLTGHLVSENV